MAMASAALQGLWTYLAREDHQGKHIDERADEYIVDTCWVWRRGGPLVDDRPKRVKVEQGKDDEQATHSH